MKRLSVPAALALALIIPTASGCGDNDSGKRNDGILETAKTNCPDETYQRYQKDRSSVSDYRIKVACEIRTLLEGHEEQGRNCADFPDASLANKNPGSISTREKLRKFWKNCWQIF